MSKAILVILKDIVALVVNPFEAWAATSAGPWPRIRNRAPSPGPDLIGATLSRKGARAVVWNLPCLRPRSEPRPRNPQKGEGCSFELTLPSPPWGEVRFRVRSESDHRTPEIGGPGVRGFR